MPTIYIAEDSPITSYFLRRLLDSAADLTVIGVGRDGEQAMADLERLRPDILITDLVMPNMDGFALIQWVMATRPIPILVLSDTIDSGSSGNVMRCLELGAMEARAKPCLDSKNEMAVAREGFQGLLRALAKVKPLTRSAAKPAAPAAPALAPAPGPPRDLLLIGASTGGPQVVLGLLTGLGPASPWPVLLAQHMECGFMTGFGTWIRQATGWAVDHLADGEPLRPGTLYLPPEGRHLELGSNGRLLSRAAPGSDLLVPSVDRLFFSAVPHARRCVALLLTGMGRDGAAGLRALREAGALTLAQSEASCVVYGMPQAARELDAAQAYLDPEGMIGQLRALMATDRRML
jgi:two-component system chemotaxis response regulator CheB